MKASSPNSLCLLSRHTSQRNPEITNEMGRTAPLYTLGPAEAQQARMFTPGLKNTAGQLPKAQMGGMRAAACRRHTLLVPEMEACHPQVLDCRSICLAVQCILVSEQAFPAEFAGGPCHLLPVIRALQSMLCGISKIGRLKAAHQTIVTSDIVRQQRGTAIFVHNNVVEIICHRNVIFRANSLRIKRHGVRHCIHHRSTFLDSVGVGVATSDSSNFLDKNCKKILKFRSKNHTHNYSLARSLFYPPHVQGIPCL